MKAMLAGLILAASLGGAVRAELWHRPLVGAMVVFVDPGSTWVLHLLGGRARFTRDAALPPPSQATLRRP